MASLTLARSFRSFVMAVNHFGHLSGAIFSYVSNASLTNFVIVEASSSDRNSSSVPDLRGGGDRRKKRGRGQIGSRPGLSLNPDINWHRKSNPVSSDIGLRQYGKSGVVPFDGGHDECPCGGSHRGASCDEPIRKGDERRISFRGQGADRQQRPTSPTWNR
jgi:hypothetical protein